MRDDPSVAAAPFTAHATVTDIYNKETDVTDKIIDPEFDVVDIALAEVKSAVMLGDKLSLDIEYFGEKLEEGVDYTWEKKDPSDDFTVPGEYEITLIGQSHFVRRVTKTITVKIGLLGDANLDGEVDVTDATAIQRYDVGFAELSDAALRLADVDRDGTASILDATWLRRWGLNLKAP